MFTAKAERPYFEAWLRRTRRQFAVSGRLSQVALILAREQGGTPGEWRGRLLDLSENEEPPTLELLTRIDAILARPPKRTPRQESQVMLPWSETPGIPAG